MTTAAEMLHQRRRAGLAVRGLLLLLALLALALNFGRLPLAGGDTYRAQFTDASGLKVGEEVRVAGLKVGTVSDIALESGHVLVTFDVEGVDLGEDTTAGVEVKTLLGQHFLSVTPAGSGRLEEGSTIPLARTSTPLNVVPAFQRLTRKNDRIDTEQVARAFDSLSEVLETTTPEVRGTLTGLTRLSASVASRDEQIKQLFDRAEGVSGVLAARDEDLSALLADSSRVLETLHERRETILRIIAGTGELSRQLTGLVEENGRHLTPALTKLNRVLGVLRENERNIDEILEVGEVYAREFANVGGTGRWFDASLKLPRGAAVCSTEPSTALSPLLDPLLSAVNETVNGRSTPCLPLGPAARSRLGLPEGATP